MTPDSANYTCPYCRWSKSQSWSQIRDEEQTIDSKYIGQDLTKMYYLDTKKKFKVKICKKCSRYLKIRSYIIWTLISFMVISGAIACLGIIINVIFNVPVIKDISTYSLLIGIGFGYITFMFWLFWKILGPSRAHVKFDRAVKYNAVEPIVPDPNTAAVYELFRKIKSSENEQDIR